MNAIRTRDKRFGRPFADTPVEYPIDGQGPRSEYRFHPLDLKAAETCLADHSRAEVVRPGAHDQTLRPAPHGREVPQCLPNHRIVPTADVQPGDVEFGEFVRGHQIIATEVFAFASAKDRRQPAR